MKYNLIKPNQILFCLLLASITCFVSCQKDGVYQQAESSDATKPGVVTNVKVKNFNGGAILTYSLPSTQNLLYVVADYTIRNGVTRQTKSSYFLDTIRVEGFAKSQDYTVTLHAVSRANVVSDPVTVTVHPDTPYYQLIRKGIKISADFGGVNIVTFNPAQRAVGLNLVAIDPVDKVFETADRHFTSADTINYSVRGYSTALAKFGVCVTDQFGNVSDTSVVTLAPLLERLLDKSKFFTYQTNSDAYIGYGGVLPYLWDGLLIETGAAAPWQTTIGPIPKPIQATFGIGGLYKLSHFVMWCRPSAVYSYGSPEHFTIWGASKDNPQDANTPAGSALGTVSGDWTVLGNYSFPLPPSGLPIGQTNQVDAQFVNNGVSFDVPISSPAVKYIRIDVKDTWFGLNYTYIMEMSFYGN